MVIGVHQYCVDDGQGGGVSSKTMWDEQHGVQSGRMNYNE